MAISTKGISPMDLTSGVKSKNNLKSKAEEGAADSFSSLMNLSSANFKDENTKVTDSSLTAEKTESVSASDKSQSYGDTADKAKDTNVNKSDENNISAKDGEKASASDKTEIKESTIGTEGETKDISSDNTTVQDIPEEKIVDLAEQLASLINQITEILKDMLGIGDEELEENLSVLDMNFSDLINTDNVSEFVLYEKGASEVDILIDEQLATLVNDINEQINELTSAFEAFDLTSEMIETDGEEKYVIDIKDILSKADEIIEVAEENEVDADIDTENELTRGSFINKNADNNISEGVRTIVVETSGNTDNRNSSSNSFNNSNESIVNNLNNAINNVVSEDVSVSGEFTESISQADIIRQVVDEIKANVTNEVTSLEMRLNPESLGRVQITVSSRNGIMQAQIVAETEAAKNAIEANIAALRETLNNQDLKVEDVEVTIASYGFFEGQEDNMQDENGERKSKGKNIGVDSNGNITDEMTDDEQLETEMMRAQGNSVNYSI